MESRYRSFNFIINSFGSSEFLPLKIVCFYSALFYFYYIEKHTVGKKSKININNNNSNNNNNPLQSYQDRLFEKSGLEFMIRAYGCGCPF